MDFTALLNPEEIVKQLQFYRKRKEAQDIIRETEDLIQGMKEPIALALKNVNERLQNPLVAEAIKALMSGKPRYQAYKNIFPEEVIRLLKVAEENEMPVADVIVEYSKQKERIDQAQKKIQNKIKTIIAIYLIICAIGFFVLHQFAKINIGNSQQKIGVLIKCYPLLLVIPVVFYAFFAYKPLAVRFNPIIRKIYNYFDAVNLLTIFRIADKIGITTNKILNIYAELSAELKVRVRRLPQAERNAVGIGKVLSKYLTFAESTLLTQAIKTGRTEKIEEFMKKISRKKLDALDEVTEKTIEAIGTASNFFQAVPLLYIIVAYLIFMNAAMSLVSFVNGGR